MTYRKFLAALAILGLLAPPAPVSAQTSRTHNVTLAANFDLDGAAASTTAIHSADQIVDSTNYTIDAQPDAPRPLVVTVVDADSSISACTYTVTGTLGDGTRVTATTSLSGGSGSKTLSPAYNWATVITAGNGVCTGEGGAADTVALGTTSTIPLVYPLLYGKSTPSVQGYNVLDPFVWFREERTIKTSGLSASMTSGVASSGAFTPVTVGDVITFSVLGEPIELLVTAKADANNITVDRPVNVAVPVAYRFHKQAVDPEQGWVGVRSFSAITYVFDVAQIGQTIHTTVQCRVQGATDGVPVQVADNTVTTAGIATQTIDLRLVGYDQCRAGLKFDTNPDGGDGGGALEIITIQLSGVAE